MRIAIDVNGVLRDTILKIEQIYSKHYLDNNIDESLKTYTLDESGNTEVNDVVESDFKYEMILPVTSSELSEHFKFPSKEDFFNFLFEDFTMEIFGHSPSVETFTFNILNDIYLELREKHDFLIVSNEIGKSKPSTLFFLSKFGCLLEKVKFFSDFTINSMWNEIDVLLTANPVLLLSHPKDKIIIKYNTSYNENIKSDIEINNLKELKDKLIKIEEIYDNSNERKLLH